jgi:tetratricopeptide (TPR) repeat protein
MRLPASTVVDAAIGREVCLRDGGIRVLIAGRVEKVGSAYILSAQLVEPASGRAVESFEEDADGQSGILRAVHALSNDVRQALGQKVTEIQRSDLELQKVTTPSLRALQLYSQADQQIRDGNQQAAFELIRSAIEQDPNFASAYILAAYALANQKRPAREFMPYAKKALDLSSQASDAERYFIEGSYYEMTNQPERAIAAYQALLRVDPGHFWGSNNLNQLLIPENRMQEIVELSVHRADAEPNNFQANWDAGFDLVLISARLDLAHLYVQRASQLLPAMTDLERTRVAWQALWVQLYPAYEAWLKDDVALARADLDRVERSPVARDGSSDPLTFAEFRQALGETRKAKAWLQQASPPSDEEDVLGLAILAFLGGDHVSTRIWLERIKRNENQPRVISPMAISLLVREGMVHQANSLAQEYNEWRPQFRNVAMGELLLALGRTARATPLLRDGVNEERNHAYPTYFLGAESLARADEKSRNFPAALATLESTSPDRVRVNGPLGMSTAGLWMRDQMDLARLYRRLGRVRDAERIEGELRTLLTYADPDYPLLVELNHLQENPSRTASRN